MIDSGPDRRVPQFQLLPDSHFGSAAEYVPPKRHILNTHPHMRKMDAFPIVFPTRLFAQHYLRQGRVYVAICETALVMHDRWRNDAAMLDDIPVIDHQF